MIRLCPHCGVTAAERHRDRCPNWEPEPAETAVHWRFGVVLLLAPFAVLAVASAVAWVATL